MSMANWLLADDLEEVTWDVSWVYVQVMYSVATIVVERDTRNREKTDDAPLVLPLEIAGLSTIEFTELLFEHEERLRHSFPGTVVEEVINNEFEQLVRLISWDSNLKATLTKGSEDFDFGKAWWPLGNRFPYMLRFVAGLASVMPGTSIVEADFSTINYEKDESWSSFCTHKLLSRRHIAFEVAWKVATNLQRGGIPRRELTPRCLVFFLFRCWLLVVISCRRRLTASYYLQ